MARWLNHMCLQIFEINGSKWWGCGVRDIEEHLPLWTSDKHTEAGTLIVMEQNHPFSREQKRRGEEACGAYWYSLQLILMDTDTLPLRAHTGKQEEKQREERVRATGSTSLIIVRKLTQHLLHSTASHSWPQFDCKPFVLKPNSVAFHQNKTSHRVWSLKFPEWLIPRRSTKWIA